MAEGERYDGLNALRGVAAIAVALIHCEGIFGFNPAPVGYLAVDLFFLMSGFVIANAYDRKLRHGLGTVGFMRIRLIRFYPIYLVGLALGVVRVAGLEAFSEPAFGIGGPIWAFVLALLFLPAPTTEFSGGGLYPMNNPAWSLAIELVINALYAALFPFMRDWTLALCAVAGAVLLIFAATLYGSTGYGAEWHTVWVGYARGLFSFPAGVLLYRHRRAIRLRFVSAMLAPLLLAGALAVDPGARRAAYDLIFIFVLSPLIVIIAVRKPGATWRPLCDYLGRTSYPLYAIHFPAFILANAGAALLGVSPALLTASTFIALLALCWRLDLADENWRRKIKVRT